MKTFRKIAVALAFLSVVGTTAVSFAPTASAQGVITYCTWVDGHKICASAG